MSSIFLLQILDLSRILYPPPAPPFAKGGELIKKPYLKIKIELFCKCRLRLKLFPEPTKRHSIIPIVEFFKLYFCFGPPTIFLFLILQHTSNTPQPLSRGEYLILNYDYCFYPLTPALSRGEREQPALLSKTSTLLCKSTTSKR